MEKMVNTGIPEDDGAVEQLLRERVKERRERGHTRRWEGRVGPECAHNLASEWATHSHDGHCALAATARECVDRITREELGGANGRR